MWPPAYSARQLPLLTYIAADKFERMLHDLVRHGVLSQYPGRYKIWTVDAMQPDELRRELTFRGHAGPLFRAVFLNYLLDCLPAAVLDVRSDEVKQLCVRTCVACTTRLAEHTDMPLQQLQERARSTDARVRQEQLEVYGLFALEYDYRPVETARVPYGEFAVAYAPANVPSGCWSTTGRSSAWRSSCRS